MRLKNIIALSILALSFNARADGDTTLAADALFQYGNSYPQHHLSSILDKGQSYRVNLFGGAHLAKVKFLSAIGLGVDFTYSKYGTKSMGDGAYYRRYQWDIFALPFSLWLFVFKPGVTWVVTHTRLPNIGIKETSIRPGFVMDFGIRIPVVNHVCLRADVRAEKVISDHEVRNDGQSFNITGTYYSWLAGVEAIF